MKFSTVLFAAGFAAVAVAQSKTVSSKIPIPTETSSYTPEQVDCLDGCGDNLSCKAECFGNPAPTEDMVKATTACVAKCDKGDGSVAQNDRYSKCQSSCISSQYFASTLGAVAGSGAGSSKTAASGSTKTAAAGASDASSTGTASDSESTGSSSDSSSADSSASGTGSSDSSASGTGANASSTASADSAASGLQTAGFTSGAFALLVALFAL